MRNAGIGAIVAVLAFGTAPCAAQSRAAPDGTVAPMTVPPPEPMPDTQGADIDLVCFAVMASVANAAKAGGKPDPLFDSAAGYYAGRLSARYPDAGTSLRPVVARMLKSMTKERPAAFAKPCLQQYGLNLVGVSQALQGGRADAK